MLLIVYLKDFIHLLNGLAMQYLLEAETLLSELKVNDSFFGC